MTVDQQHPGVPHNPEPDKPWHTPGPWRYEDHDPDPSDRCATRCEVFAGSNENPFRVCLIEDTTHDHVTLVTLAAKRDLANARLIAAAPDLFAALRQVEWGVTVSDEGGAELEICPWCGNPQDNGHLEGCALADAIAKAIGGAK